MAEEQVILNYPTYAITQEGYVRDLRTGELKEGHNHLGYRQINLHNYDGIKGFLIHRLVAQAFIPNPENKPEVDHIDRNPTNNHVSNLRWADDYEQVKNRGTFKNNTSGYKHITCEDNYFRVVMTRNGKILIRKRFQKLEDAVKCRDDFYKTLPNG